jgi:hypothetical protein
VGLYYCSYARLGLETTLCLRATRPTVTATSPVVANAPTCLTTSSTTLLWQSHLVLTTLDTQDLSSTVIFAVEREAPRLGLSVRPKRQLWMFRVTRGGPLSNRHLSRDIFMGKLGANVIDDLGDCQGEGVCFEAQLGSARALFTLPKAVISSHCCASP